MELFVNFSMGKVSFGRNTVAFQYLKQAYKKEGKRLLYGQIVTGKGAMGSHWKRIGLV